MSLSSRSEETARRRRITRASAGLRQRLEHFRTELGKKPGLRATAAVARSSADLGLTPLGSATTLTSTAEVNTTPTSFTPFGPSFTGASTAEATITGVYDGSNGDDTLTFEIKKEGTVGASNIQVDVFDGSGSRIDRITIQPNDPAGTEFALSNGLLFSFSDGDVIKNDTFTVDVYASLGSAVDPDKPFDGVRNDYANLEYGTTISNGSFFVNGEVITVSASDSLNDVLSKISGSAAGVTATFDAASEQVVLTQKSSGSSYGIVVGGDTSGFVAATKLDAAVAVPGEDGTAEDAPLAQVAELAGIASGTLTINGVDVGFDVTVDSLRDVLDRITQSSAGVSASLDASAQRVTIASGDTTSSLTVDDGGTGFFDALKIEETTYEPTRGRRGSVGLRLEPAVRRLAEAFNELQRAAEGSALGERLTADLFEAIRGAAGEKGSRIRTSFGLAFDSRASAREFLAFSDGSGERFRTSARQELSAIREFFLSPGGGNGDGLIEALVERLEGAESEARRLSPGPGALLDALA